MTNDQKCLPGARGDPDHEMRQRILTATEARLRHYGYDKTTVADIARDVNVSTSYVYKFFASKLAINEAIIGGMLDRMGQDLAAIVSAETSASDRLRNLYTTLLDRSTSLYFEERKLHDLIRVALERRYAAVDNFKVHMRQCAQSIVESGRASGEFEDQTPLAGVVDAIWVSLFPFTHPNLLGDLILDVDVEKHAQSLADLVLRGLTTKKRQDIE